jgi:hypothetical protein
MAIFKFTSTNSVLVTSNSAFGENPGDDTAGPDTLIVEDGGYLITTDAAFAAQLGSTGGAWTATINGAVFGGQGGLVLQSGDKAVSNITIGASGAVGGDVLGIALLNAAVLKNAGTIAGDTALNVQTGGAAYTITNTGRMVGDNYSIVDSGLTAGKATITNSAEMTGDIKLGNASDTLTNAAKGVITGGAAETFTISLGDGDNKLTNAGLIDGFNTVEAVVGGNGNDTFTNSGRIQGSIAPGGGTNKITNSGELERITGTALGIDTVINSKNIDIVDLGDGNDTLTNSGTIRDGLVLGSGSDKATNSGSIGLDSDKGLVELGEGDNTLTNSGVVQRRDSDGVSVLGGSGNDTLTNSKTLLGGVDLGDGSNKFTNSGTVGTLTGSISYDGGSGVDTVTNTGTISGMISLGDNDDFFTGGGKDEVVNGGADADTIKLGAGNDTYQAVDNGNDILDGGAGGDEYEVGSGNKNALFVNLDVIAHDQGPFNPGVGLIAATKALGGDVGSDTVKGFEHVTGGDAADIIYGNAANNFLGGLNGDDVLYGYAGNDLLFGSAGNDSLYGGAGADLFSGQGDADRFLYAAITESGPAKAARDVITDFVSGTDVIDLSLIDANTKNGSSTNELFDYLNDNGGPSLAAANFTKVAGQLRSYWTAERQVIEGDVNGDGKADFAIELFDSAHTIVLTDASFIL